MRNHPLLTKYESDFQCYVNTNYRFWRLAIASEACYLRLGGICGNRAKAMPTIEWLKASNIISGCTFAIGLIFPVP